MRKVSEASKRKPSSAESRAQQKTRANLTEKKTFFGGFQFSESDWPAGAPGGDGATFEPHACGGGGEILKKAKRAKKLNRP